MVNSLNGVYEWNIWLERWEINITRGCRLRGLYLSLSLINIFLYTCQWVIHHLTFYFFLLLRNVNVNIFFSSDLWSNWHWIRIPYNHFHGIYLSGKQALNDLQWKTLRILCVQTPTVYWIYNVKTDRMAYMILLSHKNWKAECDISFKAQVWYESHTSQWGFVLIL